MRPKRPGIFTQGRAARLEGADDLEEVPPHQGLTSGQDGDQRLELAADLEEPLRRRQGLGHGLPPVAVLAARVAFVGELERGAPGPPQDVAHDRLAGEGPGHGSQWKASLGYRTVQSGSGT